MWQEIALKIQKLKEYDQYFIVHGSSTHRYKFGRKLLDQEICDYEKQLNIRLPEQLRQFYLQFGNGGASSDWGLYPIENLYVNEMYEPTTDGYTFEEASVALIPIMSRFYSFESCIVASGSTIGYLLSTEHGDGGVRQYEFVDSLLALYKHWIDGVLYPFEAVIQELQSEQCINELMYRIWVKYDIKPSLTFGVTASLIGWGVINTSRYYDVFECESIMSSKYTKHPIKVYLPKEKTIKFNSYIKKYLNNNML